MIRAFAKQTAIMLAKMSEQVFEFYLGGLQYQLFFLEIS